MFLSVGPLVPAAVAGGSSAVLNVTARVVNACSVTTLPSNANPRAAEAVAQRCAMDVPHRVAVDRLPPAVARGAPPDGPPKITRERGRSGEVVMVTVTY